MVSQKMSFITMASTENNNSGPVPQCFKRRLIASSTLVLLNCFVHNDSELGIHDHSIETSSPSWFQRCSLAVKTATSRQELELLFYHHIAMLRTTGVEE
ncbi:hypothetical protein Tco_0403509 [Tanacetum coccineum]